MSIFWKPQGEEGKKAPIIIKKVPKPVDGEETKVEKTVVKKTGSLW